ncbi:PREDICTED: bidirectional sugar transporter SWEET12-like [Ipomoea nil]|uniref:bidirectional sugar transporter SWEET12-like n=1 Tax=Ipomoea nil TaxID=35883 RepID=UPI00090181E6|nr:PREDICTED: bidirectional sugar transporter SWEET12-like [Ipomoea nil]
MALTAHQWAFAFGVLGNIISFIVFLSPLPTFYQMYKKKSTEGYQSIPYVVALFSAMLWIYYAFVKANDTTLLITINSFGIFIETIYVVFFICYSTKKTRVQTMKFLGLFVAGGFGAILLATQFLFKSEMRAHVVGWICLVFSLCVFVAPLFILRQVIRTKSVECMPVLLSVFLTLSAVMWFFYGLFLKDMNIAVPNVLGFVFGILQIGLYMMYKDGKKDVVKEQKLPEVTALPKPVIILEDNNGTNTNDKRSSKLPELTEEQIIDIVKLGTLVCSEKIQKSAAAASPFDKNPAATAPKLQAVEA